MTTPPWLRAFAFAVLLPAAGCSDPDNGSPDDDPGPTGPPPASFLVKAGLDPSGGVVTVTDGSTPVAGATVELNGVTGVPGAREGEYEVRLLQAVAAGGTMTLEVTRGETEVRSTGYVPGVPIVTGPADGSVFDPTVPFRLEWASAEHASRFEVVAIGDTTFRVRVPGGAAGRAFPFSVGSLGRGDWSFRVNAVSRATMTGNEEPYSEMEIRGDAGAPLAIRIAPLLLIRGEMGKSNQAIHLTLDDVPVDGATVTVNGVAATQAAQGEPYVASLTSPLAIGDRLDLSVTVGSVVHTATGTMLGAPSITGVGGYYYSSLDPVWVEWSGPGGVDRFVISARRCWTGSTLLTAAVNGSLRRYTFDPAVLRAHHEFLLFVTSYDDAMFTGQVRPDSRMEIRGGEDFEVVGYC